MFGIITHTPISSYYTPAANVYHHANGWQNRGQSSSLLLIVGVSLERQDWSNILASPRPRPSHLFAGSALLWIRKAATQTFQMEIPVCGLACRAE